MHRTRLQKLVRAWGGKKYLQRFIDKVKQRIEIKELMPELIHEFIGRIVVYMSVPLQAH